MAYVPGQKTSYRQPRKITLAKVIVVAVLVAAVYFGIVFIPPYYGYYRASSIMKDESSKAYTLRHLKAGWSEIESKIHNRVRDRLLDTLKIPSEQLSVRVKKQPKHLVITANWSVHARWPLFGKVTRLKFEEKVETSLR
jgi:hypothetical protein